MNILAKSNAFKALLITTALCTPGCVIGLIAGPILAAHGHQTGPGEPDMAAHERILTERRESFRERVAAGEPNLWPHKKAPEHIWAGRWEGNNIQSAVDRLESERSEGIGRVR